MRPRTNIRRASANSIARPTLDARQVCALVVALVAGLASAGCGGGVPLLYPARALPKGDVRGAAGLSAEAPVGALASNLNDARNDAAANSGLPPPQGDTTYAKGALVAAAVAPGLAPFVAARVGVGGGIEGGIAYTGRAAHIDMRKSFDLSESTSFSAGLGVTVPFYGRQGGEELPNVNLSALHGYGGDVPLLIGWESSGGLYKLWAGLRGGWEFDSISNLSTEPKAVPLGGQPISLSATRYFGSGVVGMAAGFRHIHVALELDTAYQFVDGAYNATAVKVSGVSLSPATAIWWDF